jgi:hypothetical protein
MIVGLTQSATFWYGALGALIALLVVSVLPWAFSLVKGQTQLTVTPARVIGALLIISIFLAGGGVVAILFGDAQEAKHAVFYGLGWQGTLGGAIQGTRPGS